MTEMNRRESLELAGKSGFVQDDPGGIDPSGSLRNRQSAD